MPETIYGEWPGWTPLTPAVSYAPLASGSGGNGLTGCELPDGRGLLMWNTTADVRGAIVASTAAWLGNSVVPAIDEFTAFPTNGTTARVACFTHGGQVYCHRSKINTSTLVCDLTIWRANDPANPDTGGWTQISTVHTVTAPGGSFSGTVPVGVPHYHAGSGLFVLAGNGYRALGTIAIGSSCGIWTAPSLAGPWTRRLTSNLPGTSSNFPSMSAQFAPDANGYLHHFVGSQSGSWEQRLFRSTNGGLNWTLVATQATGGPVYWYSGAVWNGIDHYITDVALVRRLTGAGTTWAHWASTGERYLPVVDGSFTNLTRKLALLNDGVHSFWSNRVAFTGGPGGWIIGPLQAGALVSSGWQ